MIWITYPSNSIAMMFLYPLWESAKSGSWTDLLDINYYMRFVAIDVAYIILADIGIYVAHSFAHLPFMYKMQHWFHHKRALGAEFSPWVAFTAYVAYFFPPYIVNYFTP